jgi:hypothetical protein
MKSTAWPMSCSEVRDQSTVLQVMRQPEGRGAGPAVSPPGKEHQPVRVLAQLIQRGLRDGRGSAFGAGRARRPTVGAWSDSAAELDDRLARGFAGGAIGPAALGGAGPAAWGRGGDGGRSVAAGTAMRTAASMTSSDAAERGLIRRGRRAPRAS